MRLILTIVASLTATTAAACGIETDCSVDSGTYRIDLPDAPTGAIVFAHGYRGSAAGTIRNARLRQMALDLGLAFVALNAGEEDWALPNAPGARGLTDGVAQMDYVAEVVADLTEQHGIPADRLMLSGFSAGGMLVWNVSCLRPDLFAAFAPVSGTFWLTPPDNCAVPNASIIHMHGDADGVVPMEGRAIANTRQGDVYEALEMHRTTNGFDPAQPYQMLDGTLNCDSWETADGAIADLCMFEGGHSFSRSYLAAAWARFEARGLIPQP